jgi:hypothetical protein
VSGGGGGARFLVKEEGKGGFAAGVEAIYSRRRVGSVAGPCADRPATGGDGLGSDGGSAGWCVDPTPRTLTCGARGRFKLTHLTIHLGPGPIQHFKQFSNISNCPRFVKYKSQASSAPQFIKLCMRVWKKVQILNRIGIKIPENKLTLNLG